MSVESAGAAYIGSFADAKLPARRNRLCRALVRRLTARPELLGVLGIAGVLNLLGLSINGWANTYYSAAVKSMSTSWHDFLFASLDRSGLMTVDKPPLSLWVQALSARVFGFNSLSQLVPQGLMGMLAVGLLYDLTRRRCGRVAGVVAGFALATTPVAVAVSRHNNPDELLVLCSVAALWCALRALDTGRTRWLVLSGIAVGLGFETKMGVALMVVPGIVAAWLWIAPPASRPLGVQPRRFGRRGSRPAGRIAALRQLLAGGAAMIVVGGAWPLLVTLTPAADRPWISGTSDNSIFSLIFGYNGLGRLAGQTGGPAGAGGGGGTVFGGATGPFRLLQSGLGDQAGWLLGFALLAGLVLLFRTRLRRGEGRTGWLIMLGGAFLTTAVAFSFAGGIFHPYYVALLAPFTAALVGAGVVEMLPSRGSARSARVVAPLLITGGAVSELVVLHGLGGRLAWAQPLVMATAIACGAILASGRLARVRAVTVGVALAALLAAPAVWGAETLGHATSSTFPAGGPAGASGGGPGGGFGGPGPGGFAGGAPPAGLRFGPPPGAAGAGAPRGPGGGGAFAPGGGGMFGADSGSVTAAVRYAKAHGGGTVGVSSQSSAASAILSTGADVAGLGGFSGRESAVSAAWVASEVRSGHLRWVLVDSAGQGRLPGDTRTGSRQAMSIVAKACRAVHFTTGTGTTATMYDCLGRAGAILSGSL